MRRLAPLLPLFAAAFLPGCATVPQNPGSGWIRAVTPHFEVLTDSSPGDARRTAIDLERYRAALLARWKHPELETPRARMVVYSDPSDFREHGAGTFGGFFREDVGQELLVESKESFTQEGLGLAKTSAHELAHEINAAFLKRIPRWVNEGLATHVSTVTFSDGYANFGRAAQEYLYAVQTYKPLGSRELFGWDALDPSQMDPDQLERYYVWSWAWISYLDHERGDQLDAYLARLGRAEDPQAAFTAVFGTVDDAKMEHEIRNFFSRMLSYNRVKVTTPDPQVSIEPISTAQVHVVEAEVWSRAPGKESEEARTRFARSELAQALASEPTNVDALRLDAQIGTDDERIRSARMLTQLTPKDGLAWILLAQALPRGLENDDERGRAFGEALQNVGDSPYVLSAVARHVMGGNPELALKLATQSIQRAPYDLEGEFTLAQAQSANGRCDEARKTGARALDLVPETMPKTVRDHLAEQVAKALDACRPHEG